MAEFHFLRPAWLLLLPFAFWAAWRLGMGRGGTSGWRAIVDKALQPFVLAEGDRPSQRRWPLAVALLAGVLATLALAGPAWDRLPVPAYRSDQPLIVALDLSRSMDARDVEPSRLMRARIKLLDLLERRTGGETALVVFTANAFTVTPLTNDTKTIASLVNALSTDIMPSRGSLLEVGIEKSASLLRQAAASEGEILLITDAVPSPAAHELVASLRGEGITTHVLAVGTEEGAPIPAQGGGFLLDSNGEVVVPQVDFGALSRLAARGGGRIARLAVDDSDLDRLFPEEPAGDLVAASEDDSQRVDVWRDQGIWLTLLVLPLIALGFRRGWVYVLAAIFVLPAPQAHAFEWRDLWQRPDQQGIEALERAAPGEAAELFEDPEWLAAARYRAGQFDQSAAALSGIDTPDAHYNRGNALARAGKLAEAIDAYDRTLALAPDHEDAAFNRKLVEDLLEKQEQQQQQQQGQEQGEGQEQQGQGQDQQQAQAGQQGDQQQSEQGGAEASPEQSQSAQNGAQQDGSEQPGQQDPNQPGESGSQAQASGDEREAAPDNDTGESEPDDASSGDDRNLQAAAAPEDLEEWASEQAADQWLRRIPQDPGGLLRRKFLYQYQQYGVDQDGNAVWPGDSSEPW